VRGPHRACSAGAGRGLKGNDGAVAASAAVGRPAGAASLARTAAGRRLREIGRGDDIEFCAQ
jgi:hypothetical protein